MRLAAIPITDQKRSPVQFQATSTLGSGVRLNAIFERGQNLHSVGDVVRAAEILLQHWPEEFAHSEAHRTVRLACLHDLEGEGEPAREAFVKAAEEAGILAPDDVRPTRRPR